MMFYRLLYAIVLWGGLIYSYSINFAPTVNAVQQAREFIPALFISATNALLALPETQPFIVLIVIPFLTLMLLWGKD